MTSKPPGIPAGRGADVCIALAATEKFLPGAIVAAHSFLQQHPGFCGGMLLFHNKLSAKRRAALARACPALRPEPVRPALRRRLAAFADWPLAKRRWLSSFYCLEAFRIAGYRKVLYCDSDLLFRGPVWELFDRREALICCGDSVSMEGGCRDAVSFQPLASPALAGAKGALEQTFNSGLLLIDERLTGERAYAELLGRVAPDAWRGTDTVHTNDQFLLNQHFAGRQSLVSSTYNYPLHMREAILAREGLAPKDAKVLHFTGPVKPWSAAAMLRWTDGDPAFAPHPAYAWWHEAWLACLNDAHLRRAWPALATRAFGGPAGVGGGEQAGKPP